MLNWNVSTYIQMFCKNNEAFWQTERQKGQTTQKMSQNLLSAMTYPIDFLCFVREMLADLTTS